MTMKSPLNVCNYNPTKRYNSAQTVYSSWDYDDQMQVKPILWCYTSDSYKRTGKSSGLSFAMPYEWCFM